MQPLPSAPLTSEGIEKAIHDVCIEATKSQDMWIFRLADAKEDLGVPGNNHGRLSDENEAAVNLFGFVTMPTSVEVCDEATSIPTGGVITTFSIAYSTWDGRVLYLDRFGLEEGDVAIPKVTDNARKELMLTLPVLCCQISQRLECVRFVWQHYGALPSFPVQLETLHGWLTLFWPSESIRQFVVSQEPVSSDGSATGQIEAENASTSETDNDVIRRILNEPLGTDKFRLRLAQTKDDANHIVRLVQGLADFEKESDAVHVAADHYLLDGFPTISSSSNSRTDAPATSATTRAMKLFHCLLLEDVSDGRTCGMAFFYVGYNRNLGPYLYLEDLYVEPDCRKGGAGTTLMKTLGKIGLGLGCSRLVWQALDWNSSALGFYCGKLGAQVQDGYITSRFAGPALVKLAQSTKTLT